MHNTLDITIAGLTTRLIFGADGVRDFLQRSYAGFLSPGDPLKTIQVEIAEETSTPLSTELQIRCEGESLVLQGPGYQGWIEKGGAVGKVQLLPRLLETGMSNFLRGLYAFLLIQHEGLALHAAGVIRKGKGCLFFGPSGSGKSTLASLSASRPVLSDDLIAVRRMDGDFRIFSSPLHSLDFRVPGMYPIEAFFALRKDHANLVERLPRAVGLAELLASVMGLREFPEMASRATDICQDLTARFSVYELHFRPETSFWEVIDALLG